MCWICFVHYFDSVVFIYRIFSCVCYIRTLHIFVPVICKISLLMIMIRLMFTVVLQVCIRCCASYLLQFNHNSQPITHKKPSHPYLFFYFSPCLVSWHLRCVRSLQLRSCDALRGGGVVGEISPHIPRTPAHHILIYITFISINYIIFLHILAHYILIYINSISINYFTFTYLPLIFHFLLRLSALYNLLTRQLCLCRVHARAESDSSTDIQKLFCFLCLRNSQSWLVPYFRMLQRLWSMTCNASVLQNC